MQKFVICGGRKLNGTLKVETAKNAVLPIIAASILTDKEIVIKDIPHIIDVYKMFDILREMGGKVIVEGNDAIIDNSNIYNFEISQVLAKDIRSSIFMLGPLIAKYKRARVAYPGGCDIGSRPIDLHLFGLRELGVEIKEEYGFIDCFAKEIKPAIVHLDYPSVGATENIMMASVFTKGITTILNAAKEPEIVDLAKFINSIGGKIKGAGSSTIEIIGVNSLSGGEYLPISDRIIAGTYLIAGAMTGGKLTITNTNFEHVYLLINKLRNSGCIITLESDKIHLEANSRLQAVPSVETQPYPGFPTDLQAQIMAMQTISDGMCIITENLFETRFKHVPELLKLGAKITIRDRMAIIRGVSSLCGAEVNATDLRGGASLVLAGLVAKGTTVVNNVEYVDRGYFELENKLASLGAEIKREWFALILPNTKEFLCLKVGKD